jgi:hypothetical protein
MAEDSQEAEQERKRKRLGTRYTFQRPATSNSLPPTKLYFHCFYYIPVSFSYESISGEPLMIQSPLND